MIFETKYNIGDRLPYRIEYDEKTLACDSCKQNHKKTIGYKITEAIKEEQIVAGIFIESQQRYYSSKDKRADIQYEFYKETNDYGGDEYIKISEGNVFRTIEEAQKECGKRNRQWTMRLDERNADNMAHGEPLED